MNLTNTHFWPHFPCDQIIQQICHFYVKSIAWLINYGFDRTDSKYCFGLFFPNIWTLEDTPNRTSVFVFFWVVFSRVHVIPRPVGCATESPAVCVPSWGWLLCRQPQELCAGVGQGRRKGGGAPSHRRWPPSILVWEWLQKRWRSVVVHVHTRAWMCVQALLGVCLSLIRAIQKPPIAASIWLSWYHWSCHRMVFGIVAVCKNTAHLAHLAFYYLFIYYFIILSHLVSSETCSMQCVVLIFSAQHIFTQECFPPLSVIWNAAGGASFAPVVPVGMVALVVVGVFIGVLGTWCTITERLLTS